MLVLIFFELGLASANPLVPLIIGGHSVNITDHPYQLELSYTGIPFCSGSIVGPNKALTAMHCVRSRNVKLMTVRVGSALKGTGGEMVKITRVDTHPLFDKDTLSHDVAVLTLAKNLSFSEFVAPVRLADTCFVIKAGDKAVVAGWGSTDRHDHKQATQLQAVEVVAIGKNQCRTQYAVVNRRITDDMICFGYPGGAKDACHGDSGAPLVMNGIQVGIVSWGIGCANAKYPGVYAKISNLRNHIDKYM